MAFLCSYFKNHEIITEIIDLNADNQRKGEADKLVKALSNSLDLQCQNQFEPAINTIEDQVSISKKTPESKHKKKILKDKLVKATSDQQYQKRLVRAKNTKINRCQFQKKDQRLSKNKKQSKLKVLFITGIKTLQLKIGIIQANQRKKKMNSIKILNH